MFWKYEELVNFVVISVVDSIIDIMVYLCENEEVVDDLVFVIGVLVIVFIGCLVLSLVLSV